MNLDFKAIPGKVVEIKEDYEEILSNNDMKHLIDLSLLVQVGAKVADTKLVNAFYKTVGKVHNARWITTASNLLVLYMQEEDPTEALVLLVTYIVNCYTPSIVNIKKTPHCSNGTRHIFSLLQLAKSMFEDKHPEIFSEVIGCIENNSYNFHPEQIVLSMVTDPDENIRDEGIQLIEKFRGQDKERKEEATGLKKIRIFKKPKNLNLEAKHYSEVVDFGAFDKFEVCSPPILRDYSIEDIRDRNFKDGFKKVPSHR